MTTPGNSAKQKCLATGAIVAIIASALCIYYTQSRPTQLNIPLHQAVGEMLAETTSRLVGPHGSVLIVTVNSSQIPELKIQIDSFERHLKQLGNITVKDTLKLDPGDNPKYRPGSGLSAKHFLKIAQNNTGVDAIVSFIGAPQLTDDEIAAMKPIPKFIAETHSPERLQNLLQKNILQVAIVPRYEFPAPVPKKPRTNREWFDHYFQVIARATVLPTADATP